MDTSGPISAFDATTFAQLAEELHAAGDPVRTAEQVVETAVQVLECEHASITLLARGRRLKTLAPTGELVLQLDRAQYELDQGPCHDASWSGQTLLCSDLLHDGRWPEWAPLAISKGVKSMMAVELTTAEARIGSLNLYFLTQRTFSADDIAFASIFGRHAALAVANTTREAQLHVALDSRKLIGQAQGILMERFDLSADQAFEMLKRYSTTTNTKLRAVAEHLLATRKLPPAP